eukprot:sb/3478378/
MLYWLQSNSLLLLMPLLYNARICCKDQEIIRGKLIFAQTDSKWSPEPPKKVPKQNPGGSGPKWPSLITERSRGKTEGTKVISVLELVGVSAGIKSLSHLVN